MSCGLTMEEVHQIAFLTLHGWTLTSGVWSKEGFTCPVEKRHGCGCCTYDEPSIYFNLEDAYYAQLEKL